jgi:hypothetical protein
VAAERHEHHEARAQERSERAVAAPIRAHEAFHPRQAAVDRAGQLAEALRGHAERLRHVDPSQVLEDPAVHAFLEVIPLRVRGAHLAHGDRHREHGERRHRHAGERHAPIDPEQGSGRQQRHRERRHRVGKVVGDEGFDRADVLHQRLLDLGAPMTGEERERHGAELVREPNA